MDRERLQTTSSYGVYKLALSPPVVDGLEATIQNVMLNSTCWATSMTHDAASEIHILETTRDVNH